MAARCCGREPELNGWITYQMVHQAAVDGKLYRPHSEPSGPFLLEVCSLSGLSLSKVVVASIRGNGMKSWKTIHCILMICKRCQAMAVSIKVAHC